ncbi:MAG: hydrogenase maturation nickel metallochaperone HypA [Desulfobacula sp.]|jgi:hydrogenase nickel incorporation protein HypA/HybF|uniref:hydrogenase maturation nickel metallochaperone HypA/HybF n=1 Tax=Desulfobacula sp. TaxID=2593537 RepID=UPI002A04FAF9|nr:hydrogenase maturation nickel metallochaperone HypA [Desulfobacula sp.]MBT5971396.1 hydrogenase maturation nickel metallochaperone HypA [Desulfobacula sp.]MBT6749241.1 hydrogenase maturation nickel metallochaperone HypA [Desulfobacula sp.]
MHEMGIAQQLVQIALESIPKEIENPKVEKVNLRIGRLASVVEHSLTFCFEIITKETPLETARLNIDVVPVMVHCKSCDKTWEVIGPVFKCPFCEDGDVEMLTGREIEIISLELAE